MTELKQNSILQLLKEFKLRYMGEGIIIVGLFGSYARDSYDQFSDVDVAYEIDSKRFSEKYRDGFSKILRIEEIKEQLQQAFHKKVDLVSLKSSNHSFIDHIKQEMIYV